MRHKFDANGKRIKSLAYHFTEHGAKNQNLQMVKDFAKKKGDQFRETLVDGVLVKQNTETNVIFIANVFKRELRTFYKSNPDIKLIKHGRMQ